MKLTANVKRMLAALLVFVMVLMLLPMPTFAASSDRKADTIFFASDLHENPNNLKSLLKALAYEPGLVVLNGDHVNNTNSGSLASITSTIQGIYPGVQTFYTYAAHDVNVTADSSNPYAYARTGEVYEGEEYYVYAVDQNDMQSSSSAATASANFVSWAETADPSKVIFVVCHMPIHKRRNDNAGGATWMNALNTAGQSHDIVFLWGHNHTGESSADTSVYFVARGGSLTPQGGSTGVINFTYMNAGYIKNGYASMVVVNSDNVAVTRYSTSGSATATYSIERRFAVSHTWEITESVAATCTQDGYQVAYCADCGETKTTTIAATGHNYISTVVENCTGSHTVYTCKTCGASYSEQNATETTYDKVSSLVEGESYVIVVSNYALTYGSSVGKTSVTVSNNSITSNVSDAMIWTYENGKLRNGSKYINLANGTSSSRKSISFSTSGASVSFSSNKLKIGSYYLYYSSSSGWSARTSGSTVTLYQVNEGYAVTGEHTYESVTVDPTCTADGSVTYTCTGCGDSYVEVIASNGTHHYETVTVAATCTTAGFVTTTCTVCGETTTEEIAALGHSYNAVVTAPTCSEAGYATYTCHCGDTYTVVIPATGEHVYTAVTVEPTCTEEGHTTYTCACGETYTEVIAALGHSYHAVVTAPTCTEEGFTTYTCACGDSYVANYVAALGHSYEAVLTAPTCSKDGKTVYTCACGDSYTDVIPATGEHVYTAVTVEPTCTEEGYTTYTCACGDTYTVVIPATGVHVYAAVVTAPTCTEEGYTTYTCACGDSYVADYVAALGHSYEAVLTAPTCSKDGKTVYTCACGDTYTVVIPATGEHVYTATTVAPTCTENGAIIYTCDCGETYSEVIAATGHGYLPVITAPTCTEEGYTTYICNCGDSYTADFVAALGHDYTAVVTAPTCTKAGYTTYTCACGHSYVADQVAALGHDYTAVVTAPTCTEAGYTTYTCACGHSYVADQVTALGHDYSAVVTAPTCTEAGYTTYTCACGHSYTGNQTAALGHRYTSEEVDGYMVYTCTCGHSYSEKLEVEMSYVKVSSLSNGQYVITLVSGNKYYALSHKNNTISAVRVTVSRNEITSEITEDLIWNYSNKKLSYESNGTTYYLHAQSSNSWWGWNSTPTLTISTSNSTNVSISGGKVKLGSYYLRYSGGKISLNSSGTTAGLFKGTEN